MCATLVLLIGMTTALAIIAGAPEPARGPTTVLQGASQPAPAPGGQKEVKALAVAQAATLLAVPLGTIAMVLVLFDKRATKGRDLPLWAKVFVLVGAVVLLAIAAMMYVKIKPAIVRILGLG